MRETWSPPKGGWPTFPTPWYEYGILVRNDEEAQLVRETLAATDLADDLPDTTPRLEVVIERKPCPDQ